MENSNILDTAPCTFETSSTSENQEDKLKVKRSIHLPDEIWLKIMNYLKTTDIFGSFALVDRHFNQLTLDINYLQVKNIEGNPSRHYDVLKVLS